MIATTDQDHTGTRLLLIVTLQTQRLIARFQHLLVNRSVRVVAGGAIFAQCLMLKDKRSPLRVVTFKAGLVGAGEVRSAAHNCIAFVRIVTIGA